jgi:CoA:oxalate CoA-transferase
MDSRSESARSESTPLACVTVVDLSRVLAGPYCTMILADLGARVIKIEKPCGGDDSRAYGPFVNGVSAYFMSVNRGKESIALNLKDEADRKIFEQLVGPADVWLRIFVWVIMPSMTHKLSPGTWSRGQTIRSQVV